MADSVVAFAPGRANLIGEHTDYNDGLALPFAIEAGVTVTALARQGSELVVRALDEEHSFPLAAIGSGPTGGWRDFVRGTLAELADGGHSPPPAQVAIDGTVPRGAGLGSSAALGVALFLGLLALSGAPEPDRVELARLCSRVENHWVGARTGLLDQLASLLGERDTALRIDFRTLDVRAVPLELGGWRLVSVDSGEQRALAGAGYNRRREECETARERLGLHSLRDADRERAAALPDPLERRVRHVIEENERVDAAVRALERADLQELGRLLDASHASLRDLYDASTPAVERTVIALKEAGAAGARMMGGGFGGHVIALLPPEVEAPEEALELRPAQGARLTR
ncbi:MAG: galactokinase [Gaiellaceae bacterium]